MMIDDLGGFHPCSQITGATVGYLSFEGHIFLNILCAENLPHEIARLKPAYNMIISAEEPLIPTTVWLRTRQDPASLKSVQQALSAGPLKLTSLLSHQHILAGLQNDPLYLNLLCTLGLGIGLMLLLTCIGTLTSAWSYVRIRLRSLLVLRALGCTPVQLGLILTCEQAIIYAISIILGIGCGIGFTILALPNMIFSSTAAISAVTSALTLNIFQLQSTPQLLIVIPSTVIIGLGVVVLLCAVGIGLTATMVIRLSPAQMLRLSEDYVEEASLRPDEPKARPQVSKQEALSGKRQTARHALELGRTLMPARRSWSTLGLTLLGILVSVLFICVVPLFSQVAATAGLHDVLATPQNHFADVTDNIADTIPLGHIQAALAQGTTTSNKIFLENAGTYFHTTPIVTLNNVQIDAHNYTQTQPASASQLTFASTSAAALASQIQVLQGQLTIFVVATVDGMPDGTIVVNYADYNLAYLLQGNSSDISQVVLVDHIWIKTDGRAQSLQNVRQTLKTGPLHLSTFYDQQATIQNLAHNPLNLNLIGILALGTFAPLLLTWIGCLMASLVEIRQRQLLFGVLRALGSTPAQLARVLAWEQALIFGMSIVLGTLFGLLTAFLALPSLVLTSVLPQLFTAGGGSLISGPQDLFSWQNTPAANTVIPPLLGVVVAFLAVLALLAVILMTRSASIIALGQALRLNED